MMQLLTFEFIHKCAIAYVKVIPEFPSVICETSVKQ